MDELRKAAQALVDYFDTGNPELNLARTIGALRASLAKPVAAPHARDAVAWTPDTGYVFADTKPVVVPDDAIDWEGVAADQAMTIAMMQVDAEQDKKDADRYRWLREHTAITDGGVDTSMKENTP